MQLKVENRLEIPQVLPIEFYYDNKSIKSVIKSFTCLCVLLVQM